MGSSMQVARLQDKSKFKEAGINNLWSNFRLKYLTMEIKAGKYMGDLLNVNKLGEFNVQCSQAILHVEVKG